jgi:molybdopterin synthase sulfur carrier subunit
MKLLAKPGWLTAMNDPDLVKDKQMVSAQADIITVFYFARLKEAFGRASERLPLPPSVDTVGALREHLRARGGAWEAELAAAKPVRVALNQEMAPPGARLSPGDEVAFFPPVTGG